MNQDEKGKHKMITREEDFLTKQQQGSSSITDHHHGKITTKASSSSSSTPWLKLKDPRIVRVSRALGGKDRHSKVCTIRGLRDRRVRLSVPTAIQLYDLQDRLGLNQPSKVVDWLLDAAKHEIDELPPLQIPPGNFGPSHHSMLVSHEGIASQFTREGLKIANGIDWGDPTGLPRSNLWNSRSKSKEVAGEMVNEKEINWTKRIVQEGKQQGIDQELGHGSQVSSSNLFSRTNHSSSFQGLLHSIMPHGSSCYHLEPPSNLNISLSQLGSHGIASGQTEDHLGHSFSVMPLQSTLSLPSGSHVLVCPPESTTTQSYFPSHNNAASMELDPRQINHIQMLRSINPHNLMSSTSFAPPSYSISPSLRPLQLSMTPSHFHSQNDTKSQQPSRDT